MSDLPILRSSRLVCITVAEHRHGIPVARSSSVRTPVYLVWVTMGLQISDEVAIYRIVAVSAGHAEYCWLAINNAFGCGAVSLVSVCRVRTRVVFVAESGPPSIGGREPQAGFALISRAMVVLRGEIIEDWQTVSSGSSLTSVLTPDKCCGNYPRCGDFIGVLKSINIVFSRNFFF